MSKKERDEVIKGMPVLQGHSKKSWEKIADSAMTISNNLWSIIFVSLIALPLGGIFNACFSEKPFRLSFQHIRTEIDSYFWILIALLALAGVLAFLFRRNALKIYDLLIYAIVLVSCVLVTSDIYAMDLDQNQITDSDREYFGNHLTESQLEKMQQIGNMQYTLSKLPCEKKVDAVIELIDVLKVITPIFDKASNSKELSDYAKKYASSLVHDFSGLSQTLVSALPEFKLACSKGMPSSQEIEYYEQLSIWFTNSTFCMSCQKFALGSSERTVAGLKEFGELDKGKLKAMEQQFNKEVWNKSTSTTQ